MFNHLFISLKKNNFTLHEIRNWKRIYKLYSPLYEKIYLAKRKEKTFALHMPRIKYWVENGEKTQ